uniref:Glutathione peroxidase n=1 Tax=Timspurckia oligopyrenoides TaxID=708627 RepID=A0A7S1EPN5_9RHOD|mmetsp:Transcript_10340/g.18641  ORF Transcript_10340/g.18641 Transcript_10340/m.18641 type:complete len:269 (+) Transcript_10340:46-852(+)
MESDMAFVCSLVFSNGATSRNLRRDVLNRRNSNNKSGSCCSNVVCMSAIDTHLTRRKVLYHAIAVSSVALIGSSVALADDLDSTENGNSVATCPSSSFYSQTALLKGERVPLSEYSGQVTLVVNVASYCALTNQYEGLADLDSRLRDRGLRILAFPCNQFGQQEPDDYQQICSFARDRYGAKFDIFDKLNVNGSETDPLYRFLKKNNPDDDKRIEWNFAKFLVDRNGCVVRRYKPGVQPHSLERDILALLDNRPIPMKRKPQLGATLL